MAFFLLFPIRQPPPHPPPDPLLDRYGRFIPQHRLRFFDPISPRQATVPNAPTGHGRLLLPERHHPDDPLGDRGHCEPDASRDHPDILLVDGETGCFADGTDEIPKGHGIAVGDEEGFARDARRVADPRRRGAFLQERFCGEEVGTRGVAHVGPVEEVLARADLESVFAGFGVFDHFLEGDQVAFAEHAGRAQACG